MSLPPAASGDVSGGASIGRDLLLSLAEACSGLIHFSRSFLLASSITLNSSSRFSSLVLRLFFLRR